MIKYWGIILYVLCGILLIAVILEFEDAYYTKKIWKFYKDYRKKKSSKPDSERCNQSNKKK